MYFVTVDPADGRLVSLEMIPTRVRRFRVNRASGAEAIWLRDVLNREGERLGSRVDLGRDRILTLQWSGLPTGAMGQIEKS